MEHDGRKFAISVADFPVLQCQNCGEIYLDEAANERLSDATPRRRGAAFSNRDPRKTRRLGVNPETTRQPAPNPGVHLISLGGRSANPARLDGRVSCGSFFQSAEARRILDTHDVDWIGSGGHLKRSRRRSNGRIIRSSSTITVSIPPDTNSRVPDRHRMATIRIPSRWYLGCLIPPAIGFVAFVCILGYLMAVHKHHRTLV